MVISNYSLQVMEQEYQDRFNLSLAKKLSELFPEFYQAEEVLSIVHKKRLECSRWNILTGQGIFTFMCLEPLLRVDLNTSPEWLHFLEGFHGNGDDAVDSFFQILKHLTKF